MSVRPQIEVLDYIFKTVVLNKDFDNTQVSNV